MKLPFIYSIIIVMLTAAWASAQVSSSLPPLPPEILNPPSPNSLAAPVPTDPVDASGRPAIYNAIANPCSLLPFGPTDRFWGSAEYLLWRLKDPQLPALVTSSPAGTPFGTAGILGQPTTSVLYGGGPENLGDVSGGRFTLGYWMASSDSGVGMQVSGFFLARGTNFSAFSDSNGNPIIARPYVSAFTGTEQAATVSMGQPTPFASGGVNATLSSRLWGTELDMVFAGLNAGASHTTWLLGFRYADFAEKLTIVQDSNLLSGAGILFNGQRVVQSPDGVSITDQFHTRNQFYGGQGGVREVFDFGSFTIDASAKIALGTVHQVVEVDGSSSVVSGTTGAITGTTTGGFLALSTNIGRATQNRFAVLPEVDFKIGYKITECITAFVGYDFMYLSSVVRPGDQIDRTVNVTNVPTNLSFGLTGGTASPAPQFNRTDFWAQGITFGVLFKF